MDPLARGFPASRHGATAVRVTSRRLDGASRLPSCEGLQASLLCSASLTPQTGRMLRLRPSRPAWAGSCGEIVDWREEGFDSFTAHGEAVRNDPRDLPEGRRQEVVMYKTTHQTMGQGTRRVPRTQILRPFGLHRRIAAAAMVGVVCVFSLHMRSRRWCLAVGELADANSLSMPACGLPEAERREGSP